MNRLDWIKSKWVVAGLVVTAFMTSCLSDQDVQEITPTAAVSFYHACPDGPDLYVLIDDITVYTQPFPFGGFTGYGITKAGSKSIKFKSATSLAAVVDTTFTLTDKSTYSIFVVNSLAKIKALFVRDVGALSSTANTMVRLIHLSPDTPAVSATLVGAGGPFFSGGFQEVSDFTEMTPKVYTLEIRAQSGGQLLLSTSVPTVAGAYYTVALTGYLAPPANNSNALTAEIIAN